jgi:predicted lipoprotein
MIAAFNEGGKKHERSTAGHNRKKNKKRRNPQMFAVRFRGEVVDLGRKLKVFNL